MSNEQHPDRIARTFEDKTVLITGGTGFIGKVLLEKILRSCWGLRKIYLIIRMKKDMDAHLRLKELIKDPLFKLLKSQQSSEIFNKIEAIPGDISDPSLDLSPIDRQKICQEVEIIYHCAALVRFDLPLRETVLVNVRGTKLMLTLAESCKKLLAFTYISTAYCHLEEPTVYEEIYPPPRNPHDVINVCESFESELIEKIKKDLLDKFPNSYPFTKALSEGLVSEAMDKLPVIIFRPSCVVPIWREPLPGYTDNINGPTGLLIGAGKGVIRTLYCKRDGYLDYIPADIVANALLFSTFDFITFKGKRRVYNAVSSSKYKITFGEVIKIGKSIVETTLPFNNILWYPGGCLTDSKIKHYVVLFLFQILPALIIDGVLILCRLKPFFLNIQKRVMNAASLVEYYCHRTWDFDNSSSLQAIENLNPKEREIYKMDGRGGIFRDYFVNCVHSARLYILKETDDEIPAAKRLMEIMWLLDWLSRIVLVVGIFYCISYVFFT